MPQEPDAPRYARVVVDVAPAHLDRPFDYLIPAGTHLEVGRRVQVGFAGRKRTGWVVSTGVDTDADPTRIRGLDAVDGEVTWFDERDLEVFRWVADRYAGTLAGVLRHALPKRVASEEKLPGAPAQDGDVATSSQRAPRPWDRYGDGAAQMLADVAAVHPAKRGPAYWWRPLAGEAVEEMVADLVRRMLGAGRAVLVLAPDPASALPEAALAVAGELGADLRGGGVSDRERYRAFLRGRQGSAKVLVGERGAALTPLADLGLVIVEDEANPAYKERRAPRHHAREAILARARILGATAVLLGDLPSANLWRLLDGGHVRAVRASRATERERAPRVTVVDRDDPRPGAQRARFSDPSARALSEAVRQAGAAVVVAARGGQGSALACQRCRARHACPACGGSVRPVRGGTPSSSPTTGEQTMWECPACAWRDAAFACAFCGDTRSAPLAAGAGRLAQELARSHPTAQVARMEGFDAPGPTARPAIGVMTRGSVVRRPAWLGEAPPATVVLPDADAFLGRASLDAAEDGLRLFFAVARWMGDGAGSVLLQTREPRHPAVQALVRWDPDGFWEREAPRRAELRYPPATSLVRLDAPVEAAREVAAALREALPAGDDVLGPDPSGALLVKSGDLRGTLDALTPLRHAWSKADRKVRLDVDPDQID